MQKLFPPFPSNRKAVSEFGQGFFNLSYPADRGYDPAISWHRIFTAFFLLR